MQPSSYNIILNDFSSHYNNIPSGGTSNSSTHDTVGTIHFRSDNPRSCRRHFLCPCIASVHV